MTLSEGHSRSSRDVPQRSKISKQERLEKQGRPDQFFISFYQLPGVLKIVHTVVASDPAFLEGQMVPWLLNSGPKARRN